MSSGPHGYIRINPHYESGWYELNGRRFIRREQTGLFVSVGQITRRHTSDGLQVTAHTYQQSWRHPARDVVFDNEDDAKKYIETYAALTRS